jgi:hypothetical protein
MNLAGQQSNRRREIITRNFHFNKTMTVTCPLFTRLRTSLMFSLGCSTPLALVERDGAKDLPFFENLAPFERECGLLDDPKIRETR